MKCISSSMDRAFACGCRPRWTTRSACMLPRARASAFSARCACATANWRCRRPQECLTLKPAAILAQAGAHGPERGSAGRKTVVIIDNSRYHHASLHAAWREEVADCFRLHFLPPYSPELNQIERVWKLIRRRCLHNRYFLALSDVTSAMAPCLRAWSHPNSTLRRLCALA
jgi:hypothetical protein